MSDFVLWFSHRIYACRAPISPPSDPRSKSSKKNAGRRKRKSSASTDKSKTKSTEKTTSDVDMRRPTTSSSSSAKRSRDAAPPVLTDTTSLLSRDIAPQPISVQPPAPVVGLFFCDFYLCKFFILQCNRQFFRRHRSTIESFSTASRMR